MRRTIDLSLLRALIAVAETGGMTSAAKSLNLTQAAVSQQIRRLEELVDTRMFTRETAPKVLTELVSDPVYARQLRARGEGLPEPAPSRRPGERSEDARRERLRADGREEADAACQLG